MAERHLSKNVVKYLNENLRGEKLETKFTSSMLKKLSAPGEAGPILLYLG